MTRRVLTACLCFGLGLAATLAVDPQGVAGDPPAKATGKNKKGGGSGAEGGGGKAGPISVTAEGTGRTEEAAVRAALRAAVQQAVGTLVDAKTVVESDRVIKDEVLEHSGGFVKAHTVVEVKEDKPGVRVKVEAQVARLKLANRLRAANVTVREVDGGSLAGELATRREARESAGKMLANLFADLPKVLTAEHVGKLREADDGRIAVSVGVGVDPDAYEQFAKRAAKTLGKLCVREDGVVHKARPAAAEKSSGRERPAGDDVRPVARSRWDMSETAAQLAALTSPGGGRGGSPVRLLTRLNQSGESGRWAVYWLDVEPSALAPLSGDGVLAVRLKDGAGGVVAEDERKLWRTAGDGNPSGPGLFNWGWVGWKVWRHDSARGREAVAASICPFTDTGETAYTGDHAYTDRAVVTLKFKLSPRDLARVRKVEAAVAFRPLKATAAEE